MWNNKLTRFATSPSLLVGAAITMVWAAPLAWHVVWGSSEDNPVGLLFWYACVGKLGLFLLLVGVVDGIVRVSKAGNNHGGVIQKEHRTEGPRKNASDQKPP